MFRKMEQDENRTIDQFAVRLPRNAQQCDYGDHFVSKCRSNDLRSKFLEIGQMLLNLQQLQEMERTSEPMRNKQRV